MEQKYQRKNVFELHLKIEGASIKIKINSMIRCENSSWRTLFSSLAHSVMFSGMKNEINKSPGGDYDEGLRARVDTKKWSK